MLTPQPVDDVDRVLVASSGSLASVVPPEVPSHLAVEQLDLSQQADVDVWLVVFNEAYGRQWDADDHRRWVLENEVVEHLATFMVTGDGAPVGVASVTRFRRKREIGAGHYLGVVPAARGTGTAKLLVRHRFHHLRELGFATAESQTHLWRVPSLKLHFELGFVPKPAFDPWNSLDTAPSELRAEAQRRVEELHAEWSAQSSAGEARAQ